MSGVELEPASAPPSAPKERVVLDEILARARRLSLERFPAAKEALEAFFEMAAAYSRVGWPEPGATAEDEEPPPPEAGRAELLAHLEQLEELLEALHK